MNNNFDDMEKESKKREEKLRRKKEMKISGKSVFEIRKIIKGKNEQKPEK